MTENIEQYKIEFQKEIEQMMMGAIKSNLKTQIKAYDEDRNLLFSTSVKIYEGDPGFEIEALLGDVPQYKTLLIRLKNNGAIKGEMLSSGVKIVFEAKLRKIEENGSTTIFFIDMPKEMYRFQRRESFRVNVPKSFGMTVTCDAAKEIFKNLTVLNLSDGGVLLGLVKGFEDGEIKYDHVFEKAIISIPSPFQGVFNVPMRVKYIQKVEPPQNAVGTVKLEYEYKIGLQFCKLPPGMYNSISKTIQELSRRERVSDD